MNKSDGNAEKKKKSVILLCHMISVHCSLKIMLDMDRGSTDQLVQNDILGKNFDKAAFGNDSAKLKQEIRTVISRTLSKEKIDFHPLMALAFYDL